MALSVEKGFLGDRKKEVVKTVTCLAFVLAYLGGVKETGGIHSSAVCTVELHACC